MAEGAHRDPDAPEVAEDERAARALDDARRGSDPSRGVHRPAARRADRAALGRHRLRRAQAHRPKRAISAGVEATSTKSRRAREVPLLDQAASALDRLSTRSEFVGPDEYVFANRLGRRLDPTARRL
jgi:hypothetical protein